MNKAKKTSKVVKQPIKAFNMRMNRDLWAYLKQCSIEQEISVNEIVNKCLQKYKDKRTANV